MSSLVVLLDREGLPVVSSFEPYFLMFRLSEDSLELSCCNFILKCESVIIVFKCNGDKYYEIKNIISFLYPFLYLVWRGTSGRLSLTGCGTVAAIAAGLVDRHDRRWCRFQRLLNEFSILKANYMLINNSTQNICTRLIVFMQMLVLHVSKVKICNKQLKQDIRFARSKTSWRK